MSDQSHGRRQVAKAGIKGVFKCLIIVAIINPSLSLAQHKTKMQLVDRHSELVNEMGTSIQRLEDAYAIRNKKGNCLKRDICPISLDSLNRIRELRDITHDLYFIYGVGYLAWVKKTKSDADETTRSHYKDLGCSDY